MKILIVSETLLTGGAELFTLRLTRALKNAGLDVELLSLNKIYEDTEITALFKDITIHRLYLPFQKLIEKVDHILLRLKIDFSFKYAIQAYLIKKKFLKRFDIVHTHYLQVDYLFSKLKFRTKSFRHVVTVHGDYSAQYYEYKLNGSSACLRLNKKLKILKTTVDKWVVISDEQERFFLEELSVSPTCVVKIYNGYIPNKEILQIQRTNSLFTIGMVSRGVKNKGWRILIHAFLKLPDDCQLILVGNGDYLEKLQSEFVDKKNIRFLGFHPNPVELIAQWDVLALPTLFPYESLPTVITEALYCGKPVIASKVGEIEKMITDDSRRKAGYLLEVNNGKINEEELSALLFHLYSNRNELQSLSDVARSAFEKFDMHHCVNAYKNLYEQLVNND